MANENDYQDDQEGRLRFQLYEEIETLEDVITNRESEIDKLKERVKALEDELDQTVKKNGRTLMDLRFENDFLKEQLKPQG